MVSQKTYLDIRIKETQETVSKPSEERKSDRPSDEFFGIKILKPANPERGFFKLSEEEV